MIQVLIRDLYGGVVFNESFPNLPVAAHSISLFLHLWEGPLTQVIFVKPKRGREPEKRIFKIYQMEDGGFVLKSSNNEVIVLPEPIMEGEDEEMEEDEDDDDEAEDWKG